MAKSSKPLPPNFVDLRAGNMDRRSQLIQDISYPQLKMRWAASRHKPILLAAATVVLILLVIGVSSLLKKPANPLPAPLRSQINFVTFLPVKLPTGFKLNASSYQVTNNVLLFNVTAPSGQQLLVSEQKEPANFDVNNFQQGVIKNKTTQTTKYATAYFGNLEASQIGSLVANGTWVFLSEPKQVNNTNDLITFMQALHKF